jgi:hypothetical protein
MLPKIHLFIGIIFVILIHFIFPQLTIIYLLIILFSSVLIDADHYLYYILKEKNLNLVSCYKWYREHLKRTLSLPMSERKKIYSGFYLFHGIEWIIILFLLGNYTLSIFSYVALGFLLHWVVDTPHEFYIKRTKDKSSLIYNIYRFRKLQKKG